MEKIIEELQSHSFYGEIVVSQSNLSLKGKFKSTICLKNSKTKPCLSKTSHSSANSTDLLLRDMSTFYEKKIAVQTLQLDKRSLIV